MIASSNKELRATISLAGILSIRMLGLFMILPVFSLYATQLSGATATLVGVTLGIYGFTQACFQMPLGMLSDKIGRKPVIAMGLLVFIIGSVIAASSNHIYSIIIGRALQGAGAIGSTISAFIADLVSAEHRLKAMAILGITIGFSFTLAMILGPFLNTWIGLSGLFWLTALLGMCGLLILIFSVPTAATSDVNEIELSQRTLLSLLQHKNLLSLNFAVFILHGILTAIFVVIPLRLKLLLGTNSAHQSLLYLVVLLLSFLFMVPAIIFAEKRHQVSLMTGCALFCIILSLGLCIILGTSLIGLAFALTLFFTAFNLLEASLPSLVAKTAPSSHRGTAMGIFSTCQFFGIFCGGMGGGLLLQYYGIDAVFIGCTILAILSWIIWVKLK